MLDNATYQKYLDEARTSAMARLGDSPVYNQESENELLRRSLLDQINNRKKFSYNINEDGLYNIYRDKYVNQGRMAMRDTMGQAAALTGGYGNSYGQAVGQQAYDRALQSLNDVVPQLYGQAFNVYTEEGNQLQKRYGMANDLVGEDWNKYRAAMSDWLTNKELAESQAQEAAKARYQLEKDAYSNLVSLIGSSGYVPTAAELSAAGMSAEAAAALRKEYLRSTGQLNTGGGGGGYYGGGSTKKKTTTNQKQKTETTTETTTEKEPEAPTVANPWASSVSDLVRTTINNAAANNKSKTGIKATVKTGKIK